MAPGIRRAVAGRGLGPIGFAQRRGLSERVPDPVDSVKGEDSIHRIGALGGTVLCGQSWCKA